MSDVTRILSQIDSGDPAATEQLLPLVYEELRKLAAAKLAHEKPGQTLQATALVHEAYLRLVGGGKEDKENSALPLSPPPCLPSFCSRGHFFAAAAEAMRRILVEKARRVRRVRHGGGRRQVPLADHEPAAAGPLDADGLIDLNEALDRLEAASPRRAQLVKLRYFAGLTLPDVAALLDISQSTAEADWTYAKAWLKREMEKS
jgi:RNA polymerase sigma factor (sigma-70 family)